MEFLDYSDVSMEVRGSMVPGRMKLTDEKIIFKQGKSGKSEQLNKDDIDLVNWQRLAGTWGIRIFTKNGALHRFAGFKEPEKERLAKFFSHYYDMDMLDRELSVKGWNWGTASFNGAVMNFQTGTSDAFEIPLSYVNQCNPGKNEVTLEFHPNDDAAVSLTEIRFHIPASELAGEDPVEAFRDQVMKKASVVTTSGDAIAIFREIKSLSPHGRYEIKVFPTYIHLHGKTFDYKISASSVMRLFLLPHKDQRQMHFAVNIDPAIKQGQTRYHYLVFIFKEDEEEEIELPFTEEELKEKFDGKLEKEMKGPTYEVLSKLLKVIVSKKITGPGSFIGFNGSPAVTCSYKAAQGFIYPLERGFIYIYKPPIFIRYDDIRSVVFERSGGSTRSFDISVLTLNDQTYTFSSIEKGEYGKLYEFIKSKKISVKTSGKMEGGNLSWEDDKRVDHNLERVKNEAMDDLSDDGSMSSDDEEFNPDLLEALSAKEEYDSEPSTTSSENSSGDESGEAAQKRREERQIKKEKRAADKERRKEKKSTGGGGGGGGGGPKRERKQKKTKLPGQPKRYTSAYFIWMNESRESIKAKFPGMSVTEFGKKCGELWKEMTDKSEWEAKAVEDRKRYEREFAEWKATGGQEAMDKAAKEAKAAKRASKKAATGASAPSASKSKAKAAKVAETVSPTKGGSGGHFKSKEFIEDSDSSSGGSDDDKKKKKSKKSESEEEEASEKSESGSESGSD